jgi:hypothetical protein
MPLFPAGGGGSGTKTVVTSAYVTTGDVTLPTTSGWAVLNQIGGAPFEIDIAAVAGDNVEIAWDFLENLGAVTLPFLDFGVMVGSTVVRYLSNGVFNAGGATPQSQGDVGFYATATTAILSRNGKKYVTAGGVAAGDLDGANVRVVLAVKASGTGTVYADSANYSFWWALTNYGH